MEARETMSSHERVALAPPFDNPHTQVGWDAALLELEHQAHHLEARGAFRAAVTLYDAIRIARTGGLACEEHRAG